MAITEMEAEVGTNSSLTPSSADRVSEELLRRAENGTFCWYPNTATNVRA